MSHMKKFRVLRLAGLLEVRFFLFQLAVDVGDERHAAEDLQVGALLWVALQHQLEQFLKAGRVFATCVVDDRRFERQTRVHDASFVLEFQK